MFALKFYSDVLVELVILFTLLLIKPEGGNGGDRMVCPVLKPPMKPVDSFVYQQNRVGLVLLREL